MDTLGNTWTHFWTHLGHTWDTLEPAAFVVLDKEVINIETRVSAATRCVSESDRIIEMFSEDSLLLSSRNGEG